ncbi:MAG: hypothetical protein ACTHM9_06390 [Gemmatimonadales bacterium]
MIPGKIRALILCAALAACSDKGAKTIAVRDALPNLPLPPGGTFVNRSGSPEALQVTLRTPVSVDNVTAYYRGVFKKDGWRLVNDARDPEGATVLFAERKGPPMWVRIWDGKDGQGTMVQLSGARVPVRDSVKAKPAS